MRWGLWMAPIINTFLRQSPDPSWYNQDGAVRSLVAIGSDIALPNADFRNFSLTVFMGLLAYDWVRVIIWFDHMGLRVASLVNLSFLGGDRADEAAGRFLGHGARTRAIPDGIRRFGTWAPLLIPFYIPRGVEWDKAWNGAEALSHGGPVPGPVQNSRCRLCHGGQKDTLLVLNKADALPDRVRLEGLLHRYPNAIPISARNGFGIDKLTVAVSDALSRSFLDVDIECGVDNGRMLAYLAANGKVLSKTFHDTRIVVHCRISQHFLSRMENDGVVVRPHDMNGKT